MLDYKFILNKSVSLKEHTEASLAIFLNKLCKNPQAYLNRGQTIEGKIASLLNGEKTAALNHTINLTDEDIKNNVPGGDFGLITSDGAHISTGIEAAEIIKEYIDCLEPTNPNFARTANLRKNWDKYFPIIRRVLTAYIGTWG